MVNGTDGIAALLNGNVNFEDHEGIGAVERQVVSAGGCLICGSRGVLIRV